MEVDRGEFRKFTTKLLSRYRGLQAVSWNPIIEAGYRLAYEQAMRVEGISGFQIKERDESGRLVRAGSRPEYVTVHFIEPLDRNQAALGFDVASDSTRRSAIERAFTTRLPAATARITLIQDDESQFGVLILDPLLEVDQNGHEDVRGFVVGVFRLADMVRESLATHDLDDLSLTMSDLSAEPGSRLLFASSPSDPTASAASDPGATLLQQRTDVEFAGRNWELHTLAKPSYLRSTRSLDAWLILVAGLLFTGLLGAFLLVLNGNAVVEARRSTELATTNDELTRSVTALREAENALQLSNKELTRHNDEMEQFIYTASHDLKTPLVTINGFMAVLNDEIQAGDQDQIADSMKRIKSAATRMGQLIEDLLQISRIGRTEDETEIVDVESLVAELVDERRHQLSQRDIAFEVQPGLPASMADRTRLMQVFDNLIGNAVKYGCAEGPGKISIGGTVREGLSEYFVRDTGPGIPPEFHDRVFRLFTRLKSDKDGTGVGLAIVKRVVEHYGGMVWVERDLPVGAGFRFTIPHGADAEVDDAEASDREVSLA